MHATRSPSPGPGGPDDDPAAGPEPLVPFRQFLLKIHSRCDLACDYCYMYEAADQSWRGRPRRMELETVRRTAALIAAHAREHRPAEVRIVLHGGEPLLVGARHLEELLGVLTGALEGVTVPRFVLQTNGVRLGRSPRSWRCWTGTASGSG